tara:strand:- start:984 stop:1367 length:384 start_codon:yes stop_codon:yes gene_type:complete
MKTNEFKKILKPLIKQCIKEVIFEEGVLSGIISEVMKGVNAAPVVREQREQKVASKPTNGYAKKQLQEQKKKMLDAVGRGSFNGIDIFEGTKPLTESNQQSPLANIEPGDAGVDISGMFNSNWSKLI